MSLILLSLGTGLGLSSVSPWSEHPRLQLVRKLILWLILMQFMSFSLGGYLAGRLRTKWASIHTDEVYFRDTAHGFLVWAVGLVITASFLPSAAASMMGTTHPGSGGVRSSESGAVTGGERALDPNQYFVDTLFRSSPSTASSGRADASVRGEASLILTNGLRHGNLPASDKNYLVDLVTANTGLSEPEADKRVSNVSGNAQEVADAARKALAHLSLWLFAALLIGAFCASYAATIGGRQRDHVKLV
jgi:hypothetical protein